MKEKSRRILGKLSGGRNVRSEDKRESSQPEYQTPLCHLREEEDENGRVEKKAGKMGGGTERRKSHQSLHAPGAQYNRLELKRREDKR